MQMEKEAGKDNKCVLLLSKTLKKQIWASRKVPKPLSIKTNSSSRANETEFLFHFCIAFDYQLESILFTTFFMCHNTSLNIYFWEKVFKLYIDVKT